MCTTDSSVGQQALHTMGVMKSLGFNLQQKTQVVLTPQLQQIMKLLQLTNMELKEFVDTELAENPFLQCDDTGESSDGAVRITDHESVTDSYSIFENSSDLGYIRQAKHQVDTKRRFLENAFAVEVSLYEHLLSQLKLMDLTEKEFTLAEAFVFSLNADGYLLVSLEEIAHSMSVDVDECAKVLSMIQKLDPPGIGGRNLREVLLIQIQQLENKDNIVESIIQDDLELLKQNKHKKILSKYNISFTRLNKALTCISKLEPIPARQFSVQCTNYIVPDVVVKRTGSGFDIIADQQSLLSLRVEPSYKDAVRSQDVSAPTKAFFQEKYEKARLLVFALKKRHQTIVRITEELIQAQQSFFLEGALHLKPLRLKDIAERIHMHESTVSRALSNKYIETPWGIFSFKYFFSRGIHQGKANVQSSQSIKELMKLLLREHKNLSDSTLAKLLLERGITVARRTIAKYRKDMHIDSSYTRK